MHDLNSARQRLLEFWKEGKFDEGDSFYWNEVFPLAEAKFLSETKVEQRYDWLIMPGGFVPAYHIFLIRALKPKEVYFIGTREFKEQHLDEVIKKTGLQPSQYIVDVVEYKGMNLTEVYDKIRKRLDLFVGKKVILDLTRGKRIMSIGAGIVGAFFGFDLVYLDKEWDSYFKRGIPGTEKLVMVKNPFEVFGDLELREAREFFATYNYGAALALYKRIRQKIVDPRAVEIEELLSEAYMHWNSFNFKAAHLKLRQAIMKSRQYNVPVNAEVLENMKALELLQSDEASSYYERGDEYTLHLIVDLYMNALRKAEVGMFEDAVSRLYRAIELISQHRLHSHEIQTVGSDLTKFNEEYAKLSKELYGVEKQLPYEIGLKDGYLLLYILRDYIVADETTTSLRAMFGAIRARDMSIIAHGLQLAGEKVFVNMRDIAKKFIHKICAHQEKDVAHLMKQHSFVKL